MSSLGASSPPIVDLNALIDGQKIRASAIVFLVFATLAMVADGFDIAAMGYIAPELVKEWHVERAALVPVLSASVFGLLFGAPLLGFVGDRFGRKRAIIVTLAVVGGFTLLSIAATSLNQLVVLRFLTGIGLGGLIPNVIALAAEVAPKRRRGLFIVIVNFGVPAGIALPGWVAASIVPHYGWHAILLAGGLLPLFVVLCVVLFLRESVRYLLERGDREAELRRAVQAIRPDLAIDVGTRFVTEVSTPSSRRVGSPARLFAGGLAIVTPVLWVVLAANQFTNFFVVSWLPTLLQAGGASTAQAGVTASMFATGGLVGGVVLLFVIDRFGAIPIVILFLLGAPTVAIIGSADLSRNVLGLVIAAAGFCVTGNNFGLSGVLGMIYPTPVRSNGTGWAQAMGRVGALIAQVVGGWLLAQHLPLSDVFFAPASSLVIGAVASGLLVMLCFRRFGSWRVEETRASDRPVALEFPGFTEKRHA